MVQRPTGQEVGSEPADTSRTTGQRIYHEQLYTPLLEGRSHRPRTFGLCLGQTVSEGSAFAIAGCQGVRAFVNNEQADKGTNGGVCVLPTNEQQSVFSIATTARVQRGVNWRAFSSAIGGHRCSVLYNDAVRLQTIHHVQRQYFASVAEKSMYEVYFQEVWARAGPPTRQ